MPAMGGKRTFGLDASSVGFAPISVFQRTPNIARKRTLVQLSDFRL